MSKLKPSVSIIMGSTSDLPVVEKAAAFLEEMEIGFEMKALSAHRTPDEVADYARNAKSRGVRVIIAAAGMSAALPGVIAAYTSLPVIGLPIAASLQGEDALLSVTMMPPGVPVASVGIGAALNAGILAARILALCDDKVAERYDAYRNSLRDKITKANSDLDKIDGYKFKV